MNSKDEIADWYDQHSKSVLSFILFMVKDYQQAEDLTHDTFVKMSAITRRMFQISY